MNPINNVDGYNIKCPDIYRPALSDLSASDAGRMEDGKMNKMRIGKTEKFTVGWLYLSLSECADIISKFSPEYFNITLLDPVIGGLRTAEFYRGDIEWGDFLEALGVWDSMSFNIIERGVT